MQMKSNKNGVKLLAAVMVFAMAFAGIFVAISGEESDATAPTENPFGDLVKSGATYNAGVYTLKENVTITLTADLTVNDVKFVLGGHKLTITSTDATKPNTLTINYAASEVGEDIFTNGNLEVSNANLNVTLSAADSVKDKEAGLHILDVGMTLDIKGKSTVTFTQSANAKGQTIAEGSEVNIDKADAKLVLSGCNTVAATTINMDASKLEVKNPNATGLAVFLNMSNNAEVKLTGATATKGDINLYASSIINSKVTSDGAIKFYNGSAADQTYTMTGSIITAKTFGYWAATAGKTVTLNGGTYNGDITLDDKYSYKFVSATYNGTITNVKTVVNDTITSVATFTNLVSKASGITISQGSISINGEIATPNNGKIVVSSGEAVITGSVDANTTLVIEEAAKASGSFTNNGTVEVYGELEGSVTNTAGKMVIAPTSNVSATITGGSIVQDAEMNVPFYIGGELEKSMEIGNATLNDTLHIPEGKVLTVDGNLFLNGKVIVVDGELVVSKNGCIYDVSTGKIVISKGTITNNGIIGNAKAVTVAYDEDISNLGDAKPIVSMQGVAGVNFTVKKIDGNNTVIVSGDITRISAVEKNEITIHSNAVIGDLTIAKKVKLIVDDVNSAANSTIVINGAIASSASTKTIYLGFASTFVMNGSSDGNVTISAATGLLKDNASFEDGAEKAVTITPGNNVTGFTIYTKKVAVAESSTTKYYMRAYINGTLDKIESSSTATDKETVAITGEFYVAADETITVSKDAKIATREGFKANISGSIVFAKNIENPLGNNYVGAFYEITTGTAPNTATTLYYTTFSAAIAIIGDVDEKYIESTIDKVEADFTVKADEYVKFVGATGATVTSKATVAVETDGTVEGIKVVEGMVVVKDGATCAIPTGGYAAKSVSADNTITYAGLKVAIENAVEGDVIVISSGETTESLTIPAGVTVTVNNDLKVGGDLTVSEGASLIIKGSLTMTNTTKDVTTQVIGTLDVSNGTYDQGAKSTLKSTGAAVFNNTVDLTTLKFSGAYYNDANSNVVITTVAKAVNGAFASAQTNVNVKGTVNESGEITLKDMNITLIAGAVVKLGTVTLDKAKIDASAAGAKLTATIVGMNGDGDKAVSSSVKTSESNIVIEQTATVKADDSVSNKFTVSDVKGTVTIASGNVNFAADVTIADVKYKLVVADGATLTLDQNLTINEGVSFIVDGTVVVSGKTLDLKSEKAEINGTVEVTKAGTVSLTDAVINGTIDVKVEKDKDNKILIKDEIAFGKAATSIGADAKIIGKVVFGEDALGNAVEYIIAYPGVDLSQAVINPDPVTGEITAVSTTYSINGVQYATVYAVEDSTAINSAITLAMIKDIKGLNFSEYDGATAAAAFTWYNEDGTKANGKVGDVSSVILDVPVSEQKVTVSVGTGISLYIDGVKYNSGSEPSLTVGEHKVTATVNPGYKGTVDIMVNGVKITNGVFTVTLGVNTVVSATGNITIDSGETPVTPVQPTEKDDGMGITDYLLIVLVVLAAILVVIVAIRMMRS